jgi:lipoprotein-anchoring transpeptidase ErfK/SrfK
MLRQVVDYRNNEPPGTIVVDTAARHLYLVEANGNTMRYGIGTRVPG